MSTQKKKSSKKGDQKTFAARRTVNPPGEGSHQASTGDNTTFQHHDASRRLGDYEGTGATPVPAIAGISEERGGVSPPASGAARRQPAGEALTGGLTPRRS